MMSNFMEWPLTFDGLSFHCTARSRKQRISITTSFPVPGQYGRDGPLRLSFLTIDAEDVVRSERIQTY